MTKREAVPRLSGELKDLLKIAGELRDLPQAEFKARLKSQLETGSNPMESSAPEGLHSLTPYLVVNGAADLIDFLKRAFDATEVMRVKNADGKIMHAQVMVAGSAVEVADATPEYHPTPTAIWLFVPDSDAVIRRAIAAGATALSPIADQEYGNREGSVKDPFGNHWYIATRLPQARKFPEEVRTVTPYLHPSESGKVIEFMRTAFGAEELERHEGGGVVYHAQVKIGDSVIAMGDAHGPYQPMPPALHLYVRDADAVYNRAIRAGAESLYAPHDAPYGERSGGVRDPFGNQWYIATPLKTAESPAAAAKEELPPPRRGVMPFMYVEDVAQAFGFYQRVFGVEETMRESEGGRPTHLQMRLGDAQFMLRDVTTEDLAEYRAKGFAASPHQLGGTPAHMYLYVADVDSVFRRAVAEGCEIADPLENKPWGDRSGGFRDPFGHIWYVATPIGKSE